MQRYFISANNWSENNIITITDDDLHHLVRVMRMNVGDNIICNHPNGTQALCSIDTISESAVTAIVIEWLDSESELPIHVSIAQGLPKGDKLELILQKGTELGAASFIPVEMSRSIVKWDKTKADKKIQRYRKIVKEASEQSHRNQIPEITELASFKQMIERSKSYDVKLFAYEEEARSDNFSRLSDVLNKLQPNQSLLASIGPEGGYTSEEVEALKAAGFRSVRLGPRILRTETAPLYLLSSISYHFEELRC